MPKMLRTGLLVCAAVAACWVLLRVLMPREVAEAVGMVYVESIVLPPALQIGGFLALWETLVAVTAVLDWREAKLSVVGWRQAWAVAHVTMFIRAFRRARWVAAGVRRQVATLRADRRHRLALRQAQNEYVVIDPAEPFDGVVIEQAREEDAA